MQRQNRPLSQYNIDITRYKDQQTAVQGEELATSILFMRAECGLLKQDLVVHCTTWQQRLTGILNDNAREELESIVNMFKDNTERLSTKPKDLEELADKVNLLKSLQASKSETEARFGPVEDKYASLAKFDVTPTEEEAAALAGIHIQWGGISRYTSSCRRHAPGIKSYNEARS